MWSRSTGRKSGSPDWAWRFAHFCCLTAPGHRTTREGAAQFLWEELRSDRQAGNMRQLLLRLRRIDASLGLPLLETLECNNALALNASALEIDVCLFQAAFSASTEERITTIYRAYTGDLLVSLHEKGERLTAWLATKRAVLREQFIDSVAGALRIDLPRRVQGLGH
jgi:DNA-binding SARP family transcriptional activator